MNNSQRKNRTRFKLKKNSSRKRLTVFRSNNHLYAQIINDEIGKTLASVSSLEKTFKDKKGVWKSPEEAKNIKGIKTGKSEKMSKSKTIFFVTHYLT